MSSWQGAINIPFIIIDKDVGSNVTFFVVCLNNRYTIVITDNFLTLLRVATNAFTSCPSTGPM